MDGGFGRVTSRVGLLDRQREDALGDVTDGVLDGVVDCDKGQLEVEWIRGGVRS